MNKPKTHMTLDDRIAIQEGLNNNLSVRAIAKTINKSPSTVKREIDARKCPKGRRSITVLPNCANRKDCDIHGLCKDTRCYSPCRNCISCKKLCDRYVPGTCGRLEASPYVCNGCAKQSSCTYDRVFYIATFANDMYQNTLISSREGINQEPEKLQQMDRLVSPLIKKGQPISHIYNSHSEELECSRSTLYNYIDACVFSARNIDLPRKVTYKVRKSSIRPSVTDAEKEMVKNRNYEAFQKYIKENPYVPVVEMDTVVGPVHTHRVLLTLMFRNCSLMLAVLLPCKTQDYVIQALNDICDGIGIRNFQKMFPVILTDRGTEFYAPEAIECDRFGEIKTRLFYCDPQCSWQKGMLEKNHEYIRYIVTKGTPFDAYTQEDITLMINHINSVSRDSLNGHTPFRLSQYLPDSSIHEYFHLLEIPPDEVCLKPSLLKQNN